MPKGASIKASWWLIAQAGDGPYVPTLPALAAVRALVDGRIKNPGALICAGALSLDEIESEFSRHQISSGSRSETTGPSLFERALGDRFHELPEPIRQMHLPGWKLRASGIADVEGAEGFIAHVVSAIFRFPPPANSVDVTVTISPFSRSEQWIRMFGRRKFASVLSPTDTHGRVVERFGILAFELDLKVDATGIRGMPVRSWKLGPLPMPRILAPVSLALETVDERGRFSFDVELRLPLGLGRLVRYRGFLECNV